MKIALLGYGTVAKGTIEALKDTNIEIAKILVRRDIPEIACIATKDFEDIINDPEINLIAELIGGEEPAFSYVTKALKSGKHVVSANKQMISSHYSELTTLAQEKNLMFAFSAAAGGGIPWLVNLIRFTQSDKAKSIYGIMNGTTNFILDAMQNDGRSFDEVLKEAQSLGYAEADPSADIDGLDVRAKLALSCDVAQAVQINPEEIPALGIRYIKQEDINWFKEKGLVCKLIGRADFINGKVCAYVEPMLFLASSLEAGVKAAGNILTADLLYAGRMSFSGAGAGRTSTGQAVANDICDILANTTQFLKARARSTITNNPGLVMHKYYVRRMSGVEIVNASVEEMHIIVNKLLQNNEECFVCSFAE